MSAAEASQAPALRDSARSESCSSDVAVPLFCAQSADRRSAPTLLRSFCLRLMGIPAHTDRKSCFYASKLAPNQTFLSVRAKMLLTLYKFPTGIVNRMGTGLRKSSEPKPAFRRFVSSVKRWFLFYPYSDFLPLTRTANNGQSRSLP